MPTRPSRILPLVAALPITFLSAAGLAMADDAGSPPRFDRVKLDAIKKAMQEFVAAGEISGAVTLVATRDQVVDLAVVGDADLARNLPMKPDTIFWIASMTKPITATAVLMLQEEGKLSIDDPVSKYIPELSELRNPDGTAAAITLRQLLTHTSGMAEATPEESHAAHTLADLIPAFASKPLQFKPGSQWRYCQSGMNTLGRVIEVVSGQSLPQFFQVRIFDPLGMKETTFYPSPEQATRLAKSYRRRDGKLEEAPIMLLGGKDSTAKDRYPAANGGLFSTAGDYARFCQMLLNRGALDGKQYLKRDTVAMMTSVQTGDLKTGFTEGNGWGLGVCIVRQPQGITSMLSPGTFGHGGAYGTQAWIDPTAGVIYLLLVQRSDFPNSDASDVRAALQRAAAEAIDKSH